MQKNEKLQKEIIKIPIRGSPFQHQVDAFYFVCGLFDILEGGDEFAKSTKKEGDVYARFQK